MKGFITIHRQLIESAVYKDSHSVHLWLHLLLKANHKKNDFVMNGKLITVERGQILTGRKALSAETGIQESKIQRLLKLFEKMQMIEQHTNNRNRLITVVSYDKYQASEQQVNNTRTTGEQLVNTNNNVNNENNVNNVNKETEKPKKYNDDDLTTAEWIFEKILDINPSNKKPNFDSWDDTIRLMRERDGKSHKEICKVFSWANNDHFWRGNILSPQKLRDKFDQLSIQSNSNQVKPRRQQVDQSGFGDEPDFIDSHVINSQQGFLNHE